MSVALTSRWFGPRAGPAALATGLREVAIPVLVLDDPPAGAARWRDDLRAAGITVAALRSQGTGAPAAGLLEVGGALKVERIVVGGGRFEAPRALLGGVVAEPVALQRARERQVEALARLLHAPVGAGVPLALRQAAEPHDLLTLEALGWLLDALPRLTLWFDPARALEAARAGWGAPPEAWADRFSGRVAGVSVHGLGSDGRGHAHPEDDGPPWGTLAASLPRRVPWALDLSGTLAASDVREARRFLESVLADAG